MKVEYVLTVYVTQQIDTADDPFDYVSREAQRDLERSVIRRLAIRDGDTDCECMSACVGVAL